MPLKKYMLKPGVNRENTRYSTEGGWYECDKIRFRQGTPEKIGGWDQISEGTFLGVCRSLWKWVTLGGLELLGVGTNLKFYINQNNSIQYYDITPLRADNPTVVLTNPFSGAGTTTVTVTDATGGYNVGDFVTFSGASPVGGVNLNGEYEIQTVGVGTYTIIAASPVTGTGGGTVTAQYQLPVGSEVQVPATGWGAGPWGGGGWGVGVPGETALRLWTQANFGESLVFGPRGGAIYYWDADLGLTARGVNILSLLGADGYAPAVQNWLLVTDQSRFIMAFGCDDYSTPFPSAPVQDPMLIRWSDQESLTEWYPAATNQAGSLRLSRGSKIVTALQSRQEILVWTDSSLYSLQFNPAPTLWGAQIIGDNISIVGPNATTLASGVAYWMGTDKFYKYDGRVQTLRCDLRQFVYGDINLTQAEQICSGSNEGFNEVWWFYCTANSEQIDRYVIYNYAEDIWYYGELGRTAWLDSGLSDYPLAATYAYNIVQHENGIDDNTTTSTAPINSYISSSEFDIDDGHNVAFVWRMLPDITFRGSLAAEPSVTMTLKPLQNAGSGYNNPLSLGGVAGAPVARPPGVYEIEQFTGQINTRVRGRQLVMEVRSEGLGALGVNWQLGAPRLDIRPDGRR